MNFKKHLPLFLLCLIIAFSIFLYSFRLKETQVFIHDIVRDTLRALTIWQNRELTLIGPPASFSINAFREFYFGSAFLYIGLIGLVLNKFDPVGAVLPNVFFFTLSIPLFYLLLSRYSNDNYKKLFATLLYAISPVTVAHARFFWNPNLIIPFSVAFWFLVERKYLQQRSRLVGYFLAGIFAGIIFNFHYFATIPVVVYLLSLLYHKQFKSIIALKSGFLLSLTPFIIFELRNNFYLTQAFIYNFQRGTGIPTDFLRWPKLLFRTLLSPLGSATGEISFPILPGQTEWGFYLSGTVFLVVILWHLIKRFKEINKTLYLVVLVSILATLYFSTQDLYLRYLFAAYPLLIWLLADSINTFKFRTFQLLSFIPILYSSISITLVEPQLAKDYLPLSTLEQAGRAVVEDNPTGKYNLSENTYGDAQALALRYYVQRDATVKPQDITQYSDLNTLYVLSPSLDKIYIDNRWELSASGPKTLEKITDLGEIKLFKFVKD